MNQATAVAHPNIALIKYWGKRDAALNLPATSSLSLTLDVAPTRTTVTVGPNPDVTDTDTANTNITSSNATSSHAADTDAVNTDTAWLNGEQLTGTPLRRVTNFLDLIRDLAGSTAPATVISHNQIPTGAGLASSASGFAALAAAATKAYGLELSPTQLSRLARRGSGSASRSIFGGMVIWHAGTNDESSVAEPIATPPNLDLAMLLVLAHTEKKPISSTDAMNRTTATSPFFAAWEQIVSEQLEQMQAAIAAADIPIIGQIAESNAIRMHATMLGATPPVRYWSAQTMHLLEAAQNLRTQGLDVYATMDAGPNVKLLTRASQATRVAAEISRIVPSATILTSGFGPGVTYSSDPVDLP